MNADQDTIPATNAPTEWEVARVRAAIERHKRNLNELEYARFCAQFRQKDEEPAKDSAHWALL